MLVADRVHKKTEDMQTQKTRRARIGQPSKLTEFRMEKFIEALRSGAYRVEFKLREDPVYPPFYRRYAHHNAGSHGVYQRRKNVHALEAVPRVTVTSNLATHAQDT